MFKRIFRIALAGLAMGFLAGCGGGSGGSQLTQPTSKLNVALSIQNSTATTLQYGTPVTLQATVTDASGNAVVGAVVTFSVDDSTSVSLTQTKAMTEAGGIATVPLGANAIGIATAVNVTASASTSSGLTATKVLSLSVKPGSSSNTGTTYYLQYISATPTRLVIAGASAGSGSLSETSAISFKVLDQTGATAADRCVYFQSSTYNSGVALSVSADASTECTATKPTGAVVVKSNSAGVANVTVHSGSVPESLKISASLDASAWVYANDQIAISSSFPDQNHFSLGWSPSATCSSNKVTYPCGVVVNVADFMGHPAPDGTMVIFATSQNGLVVGTTDSGGKATGYCTTTAGQCTANVWGDSIALDSLGNRIVNNELVAFAIGDSASVTKALAANIAAGTYAGNFVGPWDCSAPASTAICVNTFTINYDASKIPVSSTATPNAILSSGANYGDQYVRSRLRW